MSKNTTISISVKTRNRLAMMRAYPKEPLNDVLERVIRLHAYARGDDHRL